MKLAQSGKAIIVLALASATGCSSSGGAGNLFAAAGNNPIKIESEPSGADVYVMDEKVGVTPALISRDSVFPNIYPREKISLYGRVTLKKPGCADYTRTVNMDITNSGLHAHLDCGGKGPTQPAPLSAVPAVSQSVEERLERIRDLLNKGLINEEEAKKARERILNEL